jgi:hypothetical protein
MSMNELQMMKTCKACGHIFNAGSFELDMCDSCSESQPESDLSTLKARAEAQVNEMKQHFDRKFISFDVLHPDGTKTELAVPVYNDTVGDQVLTAEAIYHIDFVKAKYRMEKAEAQRDTLKSLCEKTASSSRNLIEWTYEALSWMRCECGHSACKRCQSTKQITEAIHQAKACLDELLKEGEK